MIATPAPVALSVSPARVALVAPAARRVEVRNSGTAGVVVEVAARAPWLTVRPRRVVLGAGSRAALTLRLDGRAAAGDHETLLLLTARPRASSRASVRLRLGVRVRMRVRGRIVRGIVLRALRVRRHHGARWFVLSVSNRGNVVEHVGGGLTLALFHDGRIVSRLRPRTRVELAPGGAAAVTMRYRGTVRGLVTVVADARLAGLPPARRRYRLRL